MLNAEYRVGGSEFGTLARKSAAPPPPPPPAAGSSAAADASTSADNAEMPAAAAQQAAPAPAPPEMLDLGRLMIEEGLAMAEQRREKRLQSLVSCFRAHSFQCR